VILNEVFVVLLSISSSPRLFQFIIEQNLDNEGLYDLCSPPNVIRVIKSRIMRWEGHVARMGDGRDAYKTLMVRGTRRKETVLEDLG